MACSEEPSHSSQSLASVSARLESLLDLLPPMDDFLLPVAPVAPVADFARWPLGLVLDEPDGGVLAGALEATPPFFLEALLPPDALVGLLPPDALASAAFGAAALGVVTWVSSAALGSAALGAAALGAAAFASADLGCPVLGPAAPLGARELPRLPSDERRPFTDWRFPPASPTCLYACRHHWNERSGECSLRWPTQLQSTPWKNSCCITSAALRLPSRLSGTISSIDVSKLGSSLRALRSSLPSPVPPLVAACIDSTVGASPKGSAPAGTRAHTREQAHTL